MADSVISWAVLTVGCWYGLFRVVKMAIEELDKKGGDDEWGW